MKKFLSIAACAAILLLGASCSKPELNGDGEVTVTFSAQLPGIATRAYSDGKSVDKLSYAIYDTKDNGGTKTYTLITALSKTEQDAFNGNLTETVPMTLVAGKTYTVYFWADNEDAPYTFTAGANNPTVTVSYATATCNDEKRDAFCGKKEIVVNGPATETVELYRPFAQINFGTNDMAAAANAGLVPAKTSMVVKQAYTTIDLLTKEVGAPVDATFAAGDIAAVYDAVAQTGEKFPVDGYDYLAMAYVLTDQDNVDLEMTVSDATDEINTIKVSNAPVQANYRTNIYGSLLTSTVNFEVVIVPGYVDANGNPNPDFNLEQLTSIEAANAALAQGNLGVVVESVEETTPTIIVPKAFEAEDEVTISLPAVDPGTVITISEGTSGSKSLPAVINVGTPNADNLVINCPNTTVTVNGVLVNVTASTATNTLIVPEDCSITNLVIEKGNVKVYGKVAEVTLADDSNILIGENAVVGNINFGANSKISEMYVKDLAGLNFFAANQSRVLSVTMLANIDLGGAEWVPIAPSTTAPFTGVFDGNNMTISNFKITADPSNPLKAYGFFGNLSKGTIKDITFESAVVNAIGADAKASVVVGAGFPSGLIKNVKVSNSSVKAHRQTGAVFGGGYVNIEDCVAQSVEVFVTPNYTGTEWDNGDKCGAIAGVVQESGPYHVTGCKAIDCTVTGYRDLGGIAGMVNDGHGAGTQVTGNTVKNVQIVQSLENAYKSSIPTTQAAVVGRVGNNVNVADNIIENVDVTTPLGDGAMILNGEYVITKKEGLFWLANEVNENGSTFAGITIYLTVDVDLDNELWTPIGTNADSPKKFKGTFDGRNHTISNLKVDQGDAYHAAGFFGALNGTLKNFTIDGASIKSISGGAATDNGNAVVAGSIYTEGAIENVTVKNAMVDANRYVGGVSGFTYGSVKNCSVENVVLVATPNMVNGEYDNGDKIGGIAGYFCVDCGNVISGNTATNVTITAVRDAGGIVGGGEANGLTGNKAYGITFTRDNSLIPSENRVRMDGIIGYITNNSTLDESNVAENVTLN